jgi:hypothetical protein
MKINLTLKGKPLADNKRHKVIYQVSCPKEPQKQIETDLAVVKSLWLNKKKNVSKTHPNWDIINEQLNKYKAESERLMLQYDLGKLTLRGVYDKLKGDNDGSTVDSFIATWAKKEKSPKTYNNYKATLNRFKGLLGIKGELKFSEINRSLLNKFHRLGNNKIGPKDDDWSTATARTYMGTMRTICTSAYDEEVIENQIPFKTNYTWKQVKKKDNYAPTNLEVHKLISNIKNIRHWQSVAIWLLEFTCRGLLPQDLCDFDDDRLLNKKLESMEDFFLGGEVYVDHYRGKNVKPMFIRLYPITLSIIRRLKFSLIYTDVDETIGGESYVTSIDNRINLVNYDRVKYDKKHKQFWRKFTDNFAKLGNKKANLMTPRKAFVQVANDIKEIGYINGQKLTGHSLKGAADKFYMNYKKFDTITEIDEMHWKVLEKFNVDFLFDKLINKLDDLTEGKVPKWVLMNGGVHKVGRQYKILTGSENNLENADMDRKYIKYFIPTKEWEMERELDEYDRRIKNYEKMHSNLQKIDIAEHILNSLERDMNDLKKSRKVRSISDAAKLLKRA